MPDRILGCGAATNLGQTSTRNTSSRITAPTCVRETDRRELSLSPSTLRSHRLRALRGVGPEQRSELPFATSVVTTDASKLCVRGPPHEGRIIGHNRSSDMTTGRFREQLLSDSGSAGCRWREIHRPWACLRNSNAFLSGRLLLCQRLSERPWVRFLSQKQSPFLQFIVGK